MLKCSGQRSLDKLIKAQLWNRVLSRLKTKDGMVQARQVDDDGNLALHLACEFQAPTDVIQALLEVYPDGARIANAKQRLALHYACKRSAVDVMKVLVNAYPEGASKANKNGSLPIHSACDNKAPAESIRVLVDAYPDGLRVADCNGNLPLHRACMHCACHDVAHVAMISTLLGAYPPGAAIPNAKGHLPIHLACWGPQSSIAIVETLLAAFPEGAQRGNETKDYLPLHIASIYCAPAEVVRVLLSVYPEGANRVDNEDRTPLDHATGKALVPASVLTLLGKISRNDTAGESESGGGAVGTESVLREERDENDAGLALTPSTSSSALSVGA